MKLRSSAPALILDHALQHLWAPSDLNPDHDLEQIKSARGAAAVASGDGLE